MGYKKYTYTATRGSDAGADWQGGRPTGGGGVGDGGIGGGAGVIVPGFSFSYEYPHGWLTPVLGGAWPFLADPGHQIPDNEPGCWEVVDDHVVDLDHYDLSNNLAICNLDILGDDVIYMEVDRYNSIDELEPYVCNTSGWFNNDYNGKVNSAFAKIPIACTPFSQIFDSRNAFLTNVSHYNPPIERIRKLRFTFRYHDGRLVDFRCLPFDFSLEFNMLKDEQIRAALVRVPPLYRL